MSDGMRLAAKPAFSVREFTAILLVEKQMAELVENGQSPFYS
jgi:hypothetical protein